MRVYVRNVYVNLLAIIFVRSQDMVTFRSEEV
jgi:hypothetical protein